MGNALITVVGGRTRAYPLDTVRVRTHLGSGKVVYLTDDAYAGVQIDGERRIEEVRAEYLVAA